MTRTTPAGVRPLLLAAVALLLLTCTAAAWAIPCRMPGPAAQAVVSPGGLNSRTALLLFSTAAVAAAIGLVSSAGRRL
ncbi:hypothetical protein AB0C86_33090 [Streptomyces lavendulae]|uniref:hypothetical protein n=1 Tax=Streptomyces lavendulae TaxID=1914 RepID=UPI0033E48CB5